jgi:stage V sporulation protein AC
MGSVKAFLVGGLICVIGRRWAICAVGSDADGYIGVVVQRDFYGVSGGDADSVGIYDKIGNFAGAGSIVPITGFANSVVAPAMEFRREGLVLGIGAKIFTIAGPVLVYGIGSSVIVGFIYWLTKVF